MIVQSAVAKPAEIPLNMFSPKLAHLVARSGMFVLLLTLTNMPAQGQSYPVQHAPGFLPVPQYVPRYPLVEPVGEQPKQLTPSLAIENANQIEPAVAQPTSIESLNRLPPTSIGPRLGTPSTLGPASILRQPVEPVQPIRKSAQTRPADTTAKEKPMDPHYGQELAIYRDRSPYPIDPRKPVSPCTQGCGCERCRLLGNAGRPYRETPDGGCLCNKRQPPRKSDFSVYWPRPFSARLDERHPEKAAARYSACPKKRIVDIFDPLSTFKLSGYQRTDNGYCGVGADPYGCLGESKLQTRVAGVGFRSPAEPVQRGFADSPRN